MNTTTIELVLKRAPQFGGKGALRWLRRALSFAAVWMCLAGAGWAQRPQAPTVPSPEQAAEEPELKPGAPLPAQCPSRDILGGGGVPDNFSPSNGAELTAPSAALQIAVGGPFTNFDGTQPDKHFAHTFRLPPCKCLVGAKLEFCAKSLSPLSTNDSISLGFSTITGFPRWSQYLSSLPHQGCIYSLDLAALPTSISLLSAMQTNKYLDFYVQDDMSIDYVKLTVTMCDCCQPEGKAEICVTKFYDKNRNGIQDPGENGLSGWTFQANDQAGGNVVTSQPTNASGKVCFGVLAPATYAVSEAPKPGWTQTTPVNPSNPLVTVTPGGPAVNLLFGNWRKAGPELPDGATNRD